MGTGLHKDLVDAELHEAKGSAGATVGHVLTADGAGAATFQAPAGGGGLPGATQVGSSVDTTTTSTTDTPVDSMAITPAAGTYLVWFTGSVENNSYPRDVYMSICVDGVQDADSEVHASWYRANIPSPFCCVAKVVVNGSQEITGCWRVTDDTGLMHHRRLVILEVAA